MGGGGAGRGEGRGGGAEASAGPHARQQRVGGMATPFVQSAQGGGMCSTHVHASTGWKDWASTPVHVSTGWRVRSPKSEWRGFKWANTHNKCVRDPM